MNTLYSVTDISSYLFCPRKLYVSKVLKIKEPPNKAMTLGLIRHNVFENFSDVESKVIHAFEESTTEDDLLELFKIRFGNLLRNVLSRYEHKLEMFDVTKGEAYVAAWPSIMAEVNSRARIIYDFANQNNIYGVDLQDSLYPKIIAELRIESKNLRLKGIVDRIEVYPGQKFVPIELKTGSMPKDGVWPGHRIQIAAYCLLISEHFKKNIQEGFVRYLDHDSSRKVFVNPFLADEVKGIISKVDDLLAGEIPHECSKENVCNCKQLAK